MNNRILQLAIRGLEAERDRIEQELEELRRRMDGNSQSPSARPVGDGKTDGKAKSAGAGLTAAGRKKLSDMMKARRAQRRSGILKAASTPARGRRAHAQNRASGRSVQTKSGGLTAAGRKKLADLMRRRWAAKRKAAKK
jgi:hypothetical protein